MEDRHAVHLQIGTSAKNVHVLFDVEPAQGGEGCELGPWERDGLDKKWFGEEGNSFEAGNAGVWDDEACDGVYGAKLEGVEYGHAAVEDGAE